MPGNNQALSGAMTIVHRLANLRIGVRTQRRPHSTALALMVSGLLLSASAVAQCLGSTSVLTLNQAQAISPASNGARCFTLQAYSPGTWNAVAVVAQTASSPTTDWDIAVGPATSIMGGSACDYVISNGHSCVPQTVDGVLSRFAGAAGGYARHVHSGTSLTLGMTSSLTWSGLGSGGSAAGQTILRLFEFDVTQVGLYTVTMGSTAPLRWRLHVPATSAAWQSRDTAHSSGSTVTNPVTVTLGTLGRHVIAVFQDRPAASQSNAAYTLRVDLAGFMPTTATGVTPSTSTAGAPDQTIVVAGTGFVSGTYLEFSMGSASLTIAATCLDPMHLLAVIPGSSLGTAGYALIRTVNPGTQPSAWLWLTINNPPPVLEAITPSSVAVGFSAVTVQLTGTGFLPGSLVAVDGMLRPSAYVSPTRIDVVVPAAVRTYGHVVPITVSNLAPGGGESVELDFTVLNAAPQIASAVPTWLVAGSNDTWVTLFGCGLLYGSSVTCDASPRTADFISLNQMSVLLMAADLQTAGVRTLAISTPGPGGGSATINLEVRNPLPNPTSVTPSCVTATGTATTVTVNGVGFVPTTAVRVNGQLVPSAITSTGLQVTLPGAMTGTVGALWIEATNPGPGGGTGYDTVRVAVTAQPTVADASPTFATAGDNTVVVILTGTNLSFMTVVDAIDATGTRPLFTEYLSQNTIRVTIPGTLLAAAGSLGLQARQDSPFDCATSPSSPIMFEVRGPHILAVQPAAHVPISAGLAPVDVYLLGWGFRPGAAGFGIALDSTLVTTANPVPGVAIIDAQPTFVHLLLDAAFARATQAGGLPLVILNGALAPSNSVAIALEPQGLHFSNGGTVRSDPVVAPAGATRTVVIEGVPPGQPFTLIALANPATVLVPDPLNASAAFQVRAFGPATVPLCDGLGVFGPPTPSCATTSGTFATPPGGVWMSAEMSLPNLPPGTAVAFQALVQDPLAPLGVRLTWPLDLTY